MMKTVTFIIPPISGDYKSVIKQIKKQTYRPLEVIICYTEQQLDWVAEEEEMRIRLVEVVKGYTVWACLKSAIAMSEGEYILWQEGRDISHRVRIEKQVAFLNVHRERACIGCFIEEDQVEGMPYRGDIENRYNLYNTEEKIDDAIQYNHVGIYLPTILMRRELVIKILEEGKMTEETEESFVLAILRQYPISKLEEILYTYRWEEGRRVPLNQKIDEITKIEIKYRKYLQEALREVYKKSHIDYTHTVLMIVDRLDIGGTETYLMNLSKALRREKIQTVILSEGGCMEKVFKANGFLCHRIVWKEEKIEDICIDTLKKEGGIQCMLSHSDRGHRLAEKLSDAYQIPYVPVLHGLFHTQETIQKVIPKAWRVICVSDPVRQYVQLNIDASEHHKCVVIYNSIEAGTIDECTIEKVPMNRSIAYCSRLDYTKGRRCEEVMRAVEQVVKEGERASLMILGDGRLKPHLMEKAREINKVVGYEAIRMEGMRYDTKKYYENCQIVIGTGRVALEALQCGRPVLAMGSKGFGGIVNNQTKEQMEATYFADHEAVEEIEVNIKDSIETLLKDDETCQRVGRWGKKWCSQIYGNKEHIGKIAHIIKAAT